MSVLSGPQTHVVNTGSNLLYSAYNLLPRRLAEASVNTALSAVGLGSQESATFGEFSVMAKHLRQAASLAARNALIPTVTATMLDAYTTQVEGWQPVRTGMYRGLSEVTLKAE